MLSLTKDFSVGKIKKNRNLRIKAEENFRRGKAAGIITGSAAPAGMTPAGTNGTEDAVIGRLPPVLNRELSGRLPRGRRKMNGTVQVRADASRSAGTLEHHWQYFGYDECNFTCSPGGTTLTAKLGQLGKPCYIRTHHMLCTGNLRGSWKWGSTNVYTEDRNGCPVYDYGTIDRMIDIWLANNCIPFLELGFMPKDLADSREAENGKSYSASYGSVGEYQLRGWCQPPKDYGRWYGLIRDLAAHLAERYGAEEVERWYFELWNEPDIFYWHGSPEEYCKLFDYTEAALHSVIPAARLGGPATTGNSDPDKDGSLFLRAFLEHTRGGVNHYSGQRGTRLDFTSFHSKGGNYRFDALAEKQPPSVRTFLDNVRTQCRIIREYGYEGLECVLSEADPDGWAAGGRYDNFNLNFRNTPYYASWVACAYKNLFDLAEKLGMDIRPLAWAFMFEGERCFEGTRVLSTQGIDKAVFNLFRMLARLGTQRIGLRVDRDPDGPEIGGWATSGEEGLRVLLYCHDDDWDRKTVSGISLALRNLPMKGPVRITHYRIDSGHSNACAEWERQGRPDWPDAGQRAAILARSGLETYGEPETAEIDGGSLELSFPLPVHSVSLLEIRQIPE